MLKDSWVQMTELLIFVSVSAVIQTRRHTNVHQLVLVCYADHIYHPPHSLINEYPIGLYIMDKVRV